jgi:exodeoxyribonuclease VIII
MNAAAPNLDRPMGLVLGMSFEDYLAVDAFSASAMRLMARSPWHYKHQVDAPPTRPMLNGSLVHCALLESNALAARYAIVPDDAPRRPTATQWAAKKPSPASVEAMTWWRAFEQSCAGRAIVRAEDYAITQQQLAAIQAEPYLRELLAGKGDAEASVFWIDPATGVYCKARPDFLHWVDGKRVRVVELKSTNDESPEGFSRALTSLGYHRARAHYIDGVQAATGAEVIEYVFAVVSSAPPVLAVPYWLDEEDAAQGADECAELRQRFAWCKANNQWPAYGTGPQVVGLKAWAKRSNELEVSYVDG